MRITGVAVLIFVLCVVASDMRAQDDVTRRWAFDIRISPVKPVVSLNETPSNQYDPIRSGGGPNFSAHLEYFIPHTGFSLVGGYDQETMDFFAGDVSAELSQIMFGGRWYFLSPGSPLQPYLGAGTYWNVTGRKSSGTMSMSGSQNYERNYRVSCPLLSVAPSVGLDVYFFSCLAVELDYGFRFAIDGRTTTETKYNGDGQTYAVRSPMHRHAFSAGLKASFPFRFTGSDFSGLLDSILGIERSGGSKKVKLNLDNY